MNNTIQQNKTGADFKRIIETMHNLNTPRTPSLLKYHGITKGFQNGDTFWARVPLFNANANDYALMHQQQSEHRQNNVRLFLNDQLEKDDRAKRQRLRKNGYSRSDYYRLGGTDKYYKINGATLAKTISDVRNPPDVEQERKNLDYTLRACEYIKRIEQLDKVRDKLEPRIKKIDQEFIGGEWVHMNWNALGINNEQFVALDYLFNLHRVHVSLMNPLQIAHYPTLKHLRDGREVVTKLGKYLTTFKDFIGMTETEIKDAVEKYNAIVASRTGWEVKYIESNDADGFVRIYRDCRAGSCMKGTDAVRVYAHDKSVIRLAYIQSKSGEILARCIVREDFKQYIRVYPDANGSTEGKYLQQYLKANGYTHGNLDGCLLQMIEHEDEDDIYVAPYIDAGLDGNGSEGSAQSGELVDIDDKTYIEINTDGDLSLTMTNGWTDDVENEDESECDDCGDMEHNDDMTYTTHGDYVCRHCCDNNYSYAWINNNTQDHVHNDHVIFVDDEAYHVDVDLSAFDIYYCEDSGDYYHIDDLVMTLRGFIHCDYATSIDHEDADGNEYAHTDDVHELSDGTTCHTDDAKDLQADIDREKSEDEIEIIEYPDALKEPQPEPLAPVFEVLNNAIDANEQGYNFGDDLTPEQKQHNHNLLDQAEKDALKNENN
jgi:hypothetical protein